MKRYLLFFCFIICNDILCQRINNQNGLSINIVNKIDFSSGFDATDNQIGNLIIRNIENRGLIFSGKNRYYISISFGWKYKRSTELQIDNYKGFIIDKNNDDKVVAEFSISNIKDVNKSIDFLVDNLISNNELVGEDGKFIDIKDHFMKMNMKMWDSSRPDSHAPSGVDADHIHSKGGIMIGYKLLFSQGEGSYNDNIKYNKNRIFTYYLRNIISQKINSHSLEFMYGISNSITLYSKFNFIKKETIYESFESSKSKLITFGIGDIDLQSLYSIISKKNIKLHSNIGLLIPVGSIQKKNKLNMMPYSMQLGSGHFSILTGFTSLFQLNKISGGFQPLYSFNIGENARDYAHGNLLDLNYWLGIKLSNLISLSIRQNYINQNRIKGEDSTLNKSLMILNNNNNSGSVLLNTSFGLNVAIKKGVFKNARVSIEYSVPSYMSYSGVQVGNFNDFILNLQYSPGGHKNH